MIMVLVILLLALLSIGLLLLLGLLLTAVLCFTRGPMKGMRFVLQGMATLRLLDDQGERAPLRCIRRVR